MYSVKFGPWFEENIDWYLLQRIFTTYPLLIYFSLVYFTTVRSPNCIASIVRQIREQWIAKYVEIIDRDVIWDAHLERSFSNWGESLNTDLAFIGQRCKPRTFRVQNRSATQFTATFCFNNYHSGMYCTEIEPWKTVSNRLNRDTEGWCTVEKKRNFHFLLLAEYLLSK